MLTIIPARMKATRLPDKPMADIAGKPMIIRVWEQAMKADLGPVLVATDSTDVISAIEAAGGRAVMTTPDLPSGSDRVYEALCHIDPEGRHDRIINLQGDLPELAPSYLHKLAEMLADDRWDITTLVAPATEDEAKKPQIVKAAIAWPDGDIMAAGRALYFSRAMIPDGTAPYYHHIGLYGWRREALGRFVSLPASPLELSEKLEQLRALEHDMTIGVGYVDHAPGGIDTQDDLDAVRRRLA
ncbi:MAG: 3-deoxy-manno-octulosonate cytidylyltransferase [Candidatus Puniceispirillaceae bacterium]|jgi:3-deoxy-manno-octulosonate cytidylyltransferase (CMP-KDO synthetase)